MTASDISRRRALPIGGAAAGAGVGLGISSCSSDSDSDSDSGSAVAAEASASAGASSGICVLNSSVTEGPYYLDGALFRKNITDMVYAGGGAKDGLMTVTGSVDKGFTGTLTVGINPDAENTGAGTGGGGSRPPGGSAPPSGQPTGSPPAPPPSGSPT